MIKTTKKPEEKSYYCLECRRKHIKGSYSHKKHLKYKK